MRDSSDIKTIVERTGSRLGRSTSEVLKYAVYLEEVQFVKKVHQLDGVSVEVFHQWRLPLMFAIFLEQEIRFSKYSHILNKSVKKWKRKLYVLKLHRQMQNDEEWEVDSNDLSDSDFYTGDSLVVSPSKRRELVEKAARQKIESWLTRRFHLKTLQRRSKIVDESEVKSSIEHFCKVLKVPQTQTDQITHFVINRNWVSDLHHLQYIPTWFWEIASKECALPWRLVHLLQAQSTAHKIPPVMKSSLEIKLPIRQILRKSVAFIEQSPKKSRASINKPEVSSATEPKQETGWRRLWNSITTDNSPANLISGVKPKSSTERGMDVLRTKLMTTPTHAKDSYVSPLTESVMKGGVRSKLNRTMSEYELISESELSKIENDFKETMTYQGREYLFKLLRSDEGKWSFVWLENKLIESPKRQSYGLHIGVPSLAEDAFKSTGQSPPKVITRQPEHFFLSDDIHTDHEEEMSPGKTMKTSAPSSPEIKGTPKLFKYDFLGRIALLSISKVVSVSPVAFEVRFKQHGQIESVEIETKTPEQKSQVMHMIKRLISDSRIRLERLL